MEEVEEESSGKWPFNVSDRTNKQRSHSRESFGRLTGLQITAGQRTMSGQNWVLTGQILGLPDILSGPLPTRSEKF